MSQSAGVHLIMDAYVEDPSVFTKESLTQLFAQLVHALEMTPLDGANFYEVPVDPEVLERVKRTGKFEDEGGITGFQVISTSHISMHAWPLQNFFSLDAFSCKSFDAELAAIIVRGTLGVTAHTTTILNREKPPQT